MAGDDVGSIATVSVVWVLIDTAIVALRRLGLRARRAVGTVELEERRRLEPFRIARAERRAGCKRERGIGADTGVAAEIVVIVVAHAAGDGELAHRLDDQFAIDAGRSEEHTSELQSLMRISYAVFCLKKKKPKITSKHHKLTLQ